MMTNKSEICVASPQSSHLYLGLNSMPVSAKFAFALVACLARISFYIVILGFIQA